MSAPNLVIGSVVLADRSRWRYLQTYREVIAQTDQRTADGTLYRRRVGPVKLETTIEGEGKLPLALANIDTSAALTVACAAPRHVSGGGSNVITLPAARRSGGIYDPFGFAIVNGLQVATAVSVDANEATLTTVSGATDYACGYFPSFSALVTIAETALDQGNGTHSYRWRIEAAEV